MRAELSTTVYPEWVVGCLLVFYRCIQDSRLIAGMPDHILGNRHVSLPYMYFGQVTQTGSFSIKMESSWKRHCPNQAWLPRFHTELSHGKWRLLKRKRKKKTTGAKIPRSPRAFSYSWSQTALARALHLNISGLWSNFSPPQAEVGKQVSRQLSRLRHSAFAMQIWPPDFSPHKPQGKERTNS